MKLKRDTLADQTPVLELSEGITPAEAAVLRAGALKLARSSPTRTLWIDLTPIVGPLAPPVSQELTTLGQLCALEGIALWIVGTQAPICQATTRVELEAKLKDPLFALQTREARLSARMAHASARKAQLQKQLDASGTADVVSLRRELSRLRQLQLKLETWLEQALRSLPPTATSPTAPAAAPSEVQRTLHAILKQEGWISR